MTQPATSMRTECPDCGERGRPVKPITIASLLRPAALAGLDRQDGWRFCPSAACGTAYFHEVAEERVPKQDVRVRIGKKESASPRPLCYCFGHTVEDVEAEVAAAGDSRLADAITEKCRQGLDRCPETNPQGSCCLGDVRAAEKAARTAAAEAAEGDGCCAIPAPSEGSESQAGTWASVGAMASAVLSSACCWLPLLLLGLGVSAGGVAGFLDAYRPWLLGSAALLLAVAFYLTYFRAPACPPDGSCPPRSRLRLFNQVTLWVASAVVLAFALFPNYVGLLVGGAESTPREDAAAVETITLRIGGMTCEACAVHVRSGLERVPGVRRARVDYDGSRATVETDGRVNVDDLVVAVEGAGYRATVEEEPR